MLSLSSLSFSLSSTLLKNNTDSNPFESKNYKIFLRTRRDNNRQIHPYYSLAPTNCFHSLYKPFVFLSISLPTTSTHPIHQNLFPNFSRSLPNSSRMMHYQAERSWDYYMPGSASARGGDPLERVVRLASESAVVIFSVSSCCMCHALKRLLCGMGVSPTVYELDQDPRGKEMERALIRLIGNSSPAVPVVFIGGKLVGSMDRVMASHINGTLVPLLKEAGALWL